MSGEDEVPAVDLSTSQTQAPACCYLNHSGHQLGECNRVIQLRGARIFRVRLGQGRDIQRDRSVEVEEAHHDEDSAEDDHAVTVEENCQTGQEHVGHNEVLRASEPPVPVVHVVKDHIHTGLPLIRS